MLQIAKDSFCLHQLGSLLAIPLLTFHTPAEPHTYFIAPGVYYTPPGEMGPALLRPDGTVFAEGGNGHTAIYTPPAANSNGPGTWVQGPDFPGGLHVDDG